MADRKGSPRPLLSLGAPVLSLLTEQSRGALTAPILEFDPRSPFIGGEGGQCPAPSSDAVRSPSAGGDVITQQREGSFSYSLRREVSCSVRAHAPVWLHVQYSCFSISHSDVVCSVDKLAIPRSGCYEPRRGHIAYGSHGTTTYEGLFATHTHAQGAVVLRGGLPSLLLQEAIEGVQRKIGT